MLRSDDLRFFATVSGEPSLAAAARQLNVTPSAVTQRLRTLEADLGLKLTHRTSRGIILTDEGRLLQERGQEILAQIDDLRGELGLRRSAVEGHLRVLAPFGFGRAFIAPLCSQFATLHPEASVSLDLSGELGGHPLQPWDIAVHIGAQRDIRLFRRHLVDHRRVLVASPDYIARAGLLRHPEELVRHRCLVIRENMEDSGLWQFRLADDDFSVRVRSALSSNDGEVVRRWALDGLGIALRSEWSVAADIAEGRLAELLPHYRTPDASIIALVGPSNARTERVRQFLALLATELGRRPWLSNVDRGRAGTDRVGD